MWVLGWASNWLSMNFTTWPERVLAARLVDDPQTVITNIAYTFAPAITQSITLHGSGYYYQTSKFKFTPRFPYGHAVIDDRPG